MKIVRRGTKPPKFPWVGPYRCNHCNSVFELEATNQLQVKEWKDDQRDGMSVRVYCPICEQERWMWWITASGARVPAASLDPKVRIEP